FTETQIIITGTSHADTILVDGDKGNANLYIELDGNRTHFVGAVGRDDTIIVNAGGANDRIENFSDIPVILNGGAGNDTLIGGSGADTFIGGPGNDTADYSSRSANLNISLDNVANDGSLGEKDNVMADVETILGGSGNDKILGNPFANLLVGNGGNDILYGGKGNDTLNGGTGHDQLFGQDDNDILLAKDGQVDSLDGGADSDTAQRDNTAAVKDQVLNIETSI
ncbi:MAG TPA: hypothetical protein VHS31_08890, partial [Tepidisphaeraceae bacterium]|nr:hypothetical protein [Tepidisphaeraceae bacterium]